MPQIPTTPPSGFRDFLPEACAARARAVESISKIYRGFGFQQIATSAVEDLAVLMGKGGGENEKLIFKIMKRGEKLEAALAKKEDPADLGLRFDLTLPLARYYSKYGSQLPRPFKAFHIGPVWRAERAQKGRYREFFQCDVDVVGSEDVGAEIDVISAILAVFKAFGLDDVEVHLNDRGLVYAALEKAGVPESQRTAVCVSLDKLDKLPREQVAAEVEAAVGASAAQAVAATLMGESSNGYAEVDPVRHERLLAIRSAVGYEHMRVNPALMRGFDYYTGPVFEFRSPKLSGSLGGGGRYDRLTEKFGGPKTPACGGSIGFERLMLLLEEAQKANPPAGPMYCLTVFSEELRPRSLALAAKLRASGASVDVYPGAGSLGRQFKYADAKRSRYAVVIGPDEAAAGKVKLKDLRDGSERLAAESELPSAG